VVPSDRLRAQYLRGAQSYLAMARSLHALNQGDEDAAQRMADTNDWPSQFDRLGDRSSGSGGLHPFCFLYRFIDIPSVSMFSVWTAYRQTDASLPPTPRDLPLRSVTLAQGPRSVDGGFDPDAHSPSGRLAYVLEAVYENPLRKPLDRILTHVKDLSNS